ncbi:cytidine deaminase [Monosporozyma unispora]
MDYRHQDLYKEALKAQQKSYSPYSHFAVGCVIALEDGTMVHGANIENASYGATICAERVAMCNALINSKEKGTHVDQVAIIGPSSDCITPCGICRQFLREFVPLKTPIVLFNQGGTKSKVTSLETLLPDSFGPDHLH